MPSLVGSKVERKEDKKFLTGKGRYTADINLVNQTYAYFVRSPHARATISKVDISKIRLLVTSFLKDTNIILKMWLKRFFFNTTCARHRSNMLITISPITLHFSVFWDFKKIRYKAVKINYHYLWKSICFSLNFI